MQNLSGNVENHRVCILLYLELNTRVTVQGYGNTRQITVEEVL